MKSNRVQPTEREREMEKGKMEKKKLELELQLESAAQDDHKIVINMPLKHLCEMSKSSMTMTKCSACNESPGIDG